MRDRAAEGDKRLRERQTIREKRHKQTKRTQTRRQTNNQTEQVYRAIDNVDNQREKVTICIYHIDNVDNQRKKT